MGGHLHIGFEFEFGGLHLCRYRRTADRYYLEKMDHGVTVMRTRAVKTIGGADIPFAEVQTEGVLDHPTHGIPEHVGGPFRAGGSRFEAQRHALKHFKESVGEVLKEREDFMLTVGDRVNAVRWYDLARVVDAYNRRILAHSRTASPPVPGSRHSVSDRIGDFQMELVGSNWVFGEKRTDWGQPSIQTNLEIPFLKIGAEGGLPTQHFDSRTATAFEELRRLAHELVESLGWEGPRAAIQSMFTLFFFAMYIEWEIQAQPSSKIKGEEARIAASKSRWGLLPKVTWQDLWQQALEQEERDQVAEKLRGILTSVPPTLDRFRTSVTFARSLKRPFENDHGLAVEWLQKHAAAFFHEDYVLSGETTYAVLSPAGKPLPVVNYGEGRNPTIVFEIRQSGADWNHEFRELHETGVKLEEVIKKVLAAQG
jgi:hypothetical protein